MTHPLRPAALLVAASTLALTLSACKIDNRPLLARNAAAPASPGLPPPGPLDQWNGPAAPLAAAPANAAYAYANRAYSMEPVAYDQPPEYGFAYGGEEPWAWQTADDGWMYAEPVDDGYRYYYYEPGDDRPYFVRDRDYGYSYAADGALLALYGASGVLIPRDRYYGGAADRAGQYWSRAHALREAADRTPHRSVDPRQWRDRAPRFQQAHSTWTQPAQNLRAAPRQDLASPGEMPPLPGRERSVHGPERRDAGPPMAAARQQAGPPPMFAAHGSDRPIETRRGEVGGAPAQPAFARAAQAPQRLQERQNRQAETPRAPAQHAPMFAGHNGEAHARPQPAERPHGGGNRGGGHGPGPQMAQRPQPPQGGGDHGGGHGGGGHGGGAPAPAAPQGGGQQGGGHGGGHDHDHH